LSGGGSPADIAAPGENPGKLRICWTATVGPVCMPGLQVALSARERSPSISVSPCIQGPIERTGGGAPWAKKWELPRLSAPGRPADHSGLGRLFFALEKILAKSVFFAVRSTLFVPWGNPLVKR